MYSLYCLKVAATASESQLFPMLHFCYSSCSCPPQLMYLCIEVCWSSFVPKASYLSMILLTNAYRAAPSTVYSVLHFLSQVFGPQEKHVFESFTLGFAFLWFFVIRWLRNFFGLCRLNTLLSRDYCLQNQAVCPFMSLHGATWSNGARVVFLNHWIFLLQLSYLV